MMIPDPHQDATHAMRAHFAGSIRPADEAALRAHLPGCARCRARYDRHALFAQLVPGQPSASFRLARGLGLATAFGTLSGSLARWPRAWKLALPVPALAIAATILFLLVPFRRPASDATSATDQRSAGFSVRGTATTQPSLWIYRVSPGAAARAVEHSISANDELAFAYSNPTGATRALVFAVDEHRHVYWFHPGWNAGEPAPRAVGVQAGAGPYELPAAIRHRLDGNHLTIYGWFTSQTTDTDAIERAVQATPRFDGLVAPPEAQLIRIPVEVTP